MTVSQFNNEALDQCRTTVSGQAGQYGALGDGFPARGGDATIFGKLDSSAAFSGAVDEFTGTVRSEFGAAESLLGKIERALDAVHQSVQDVEQEAVRGMTPVH
ncbi:hypothetical protein GCM10012275_17680 [Longimycelium tulufanense]|uniref:Uncharacterized protein n=1 Tax=Longimycelium tulufanense TaxID=907463 RepID=A0A8J3FVS3_9PSEU|nr:hypothetical protein [Longimycelium tulufanense]GGM47068.1 hypothetical protein GCM10012275_17680 [Longimycelium tulufanense]